MTGKDSLFKDLEQRITRFLVFAWGAIIALGALVNYLRPLLPWVAGVLVSAFLAWVVVAIVRWRRSRW